MMIRMRQVPYLSSDIAYNTSNFSNIGGWVDIPSLTNCALSSSEPFRTQGMRYRLCPRRVFSVCV